MQSNEQDKIRLNFTSNVVYLSVTLEEQGYMSNIFITVTCKYVLRYLLSSCPL